MADTNAKKQVNPPVSFLNYLFANLFFWGLLMIVAGTSYLACGAVWDDVTSGTMEFLFVIMGGGFTLVSVLDYFYEVKIAGSPQETPKSR
jgi:hypothetical protein